MTLAVGLLATGCIFGGDDDDEGDLDPFGDTTPDATATSPPATDTVAGATEEATPTPSEQTYTVVSGDTLGAIATRFGVTVAQLVEANSIADPNQINVGQVLVIPSAGTQ